MRSAYLVNLDLRNQSLAYTNSSDPIAEAGNRIVLDKFRMRHDMAQLTTADKKTFLSKINHLANQTAYQIDGGGNFTERV